MGEEPKRMTEEKIDKLALDERNIYRNFRVINRRREMKTGHLQVSDCYEDVTI